MRFAYPPSGVHLVSESLLTGWGGSAQQTLLLREGAKHSW
jgi:hypothetical protein